ncbi:vWA domain-containing protein [Marinomonas epiphytica]
MAWLRLSVVGFFISVFMLTASISRADTQFRVILDASGSMQTSDPDHLAGEAISLLAHLAPENKATLGVWQFGESTRVLLPETLVSPSSKPQITSALETYRTEDEKTDLETALALLLDTPDLVPLDSEDERHWILVTDGMVDISLDEEVNNFSRNRILNELTRRLENLGVKLHTISMSSYTDTELLKTLAVRTGASHMEIAAPESLLASFERIFNQAVPYQEVPFADQRTYVDANVDSIRFTLLHTKGQEPEIIAPSGYVFDQNATELASVVSFDHFSMITIDQPEVGSWQLAGMDQSFAQSRVITSLRSQPTVLDSIIFENERFYSAMQGVSLGVPIEDLQFVNSARAEQILFRVKGEARTLLRKDLMQTSGFRFVGADYQLEEPGTYELITLLEARNRQDQPFLRQTRQTFYVAPAIQLQGEETDQGSLLFNAVASNKKLDPLSSDVFIEIRRPGQSEVLLEPMELRNLSAWQFRLNRAISPEDQVRAQLLVDTDNGVYEYWTPIWREGPQALDTASIIDIDNPDDAVGVVEESSSSVGVNILPAFSEQAQQQVAQQQAAQQIDSEASQIVPAVEPDVVVEEEQEGLPSSADQYINWFIWIAIVGGGFVFLVLGAIVYRSTRS